MKIYDCIPNLESQNFILREVRDEDWNDLIEVYGDKNALPFFNSDNCDGDNFYYNTEKKMKDAIRYWKYSYDNKWFARIAIVNRHLSKVVGTVELCYRVSEDAFNGSAILRLDVCSEYEQRKALAEIISYVLPQIYYQLECSKIITKVPIYAVERLAAVRDCGLTKSELYLIGKDGYHYDGYWEISK